MYLPIAAEKNCQSDVGFTNLKLNFKSQMKQNSIANLSSKSRDSTGLDVAVELLQSKGQ